MRFQPRVDIKLNCCRIDGVTTRNIGKGAIRIGDIYCGVIVEKFTGHVHCFSTTIEIADSKSHGAVLTSVGMVVVIAVVGHFPGHVLDQRIVVIDSILIDQTGPGVVACLAVAAIGKAYNEISIEEHIIGNIAVSERTISGTTVNQAGNRSNTMAIQPTQHEVGVFVVVYIHHYHFDIPIFKLVLEFL